MPRKKGKEEIKSVDIDLDSIKKELNDYIDEKVEKSVSVKVKEEFLSEIDKANKRLIREKNKKIIVKNIFLFLFLVIIVFLMFLLYKDGHFDKYFRHDKNENKEVISETDKDKNVDKEIPSEEISLEDLKANYGKYLDSYVLNSNSIYLEDFYKGNLSNELINYWTFNNLDFSSFEKGDDYQVIDSKIFCEKHDELFLDECSLTTFDYDGHKIRFLQKIDSFMSDEILEKVGSNIYREIIDIKVNDDIVTIETVEALIDSEGVYRVYPYKYVGESTKSITDYQDSLNHISYEFKNGKLQSIK